jgi:hypothetical protein
MQACTMPYSTGNQKYSFRNIYFTNFEALKLRIND